MSQHDFLVEIGAEELPPKALKLMSEAFHKSVISGLQELELSFDSSQAFASPRRLAVLVQGLASQAADKTVTVEGPPKKVALDNDGNYTRAAQAFATKNGISVDDLMFEDTKKGEKLVHRASKTGAKAADVLADIVKHAIDAIPVPKRMRWGASRDEFSRPIQWLVMLLDEVVIPSQMFGLEAGNLSRGHRVHADDAIEIDAPAQYEALMRDTGYVIVDYEQRRDNIRQQVLTQAEGLGGIAVMGDDLLSEVAGLVEYPVALTGQFEPSFLSVPKEALISSMIAHQKYFPVIDKDGNLLPNFIFISNIDSEDPQQVVSGNERVIRPRLADAAFFYKTDLKHSLESRLVALDRVVFQTKLGSVGEKSRRIASLSRYIADVLGGNTDHADRAGLLCKTDLVSEMVLEFSDLQGIAGSYYALNDGESPDIADAIKDHYLPQQMGDAVPSHLTSAAVALADRIDSLVGIFGIGLLPTGSKDPFALRRAALGIIRIIQQNAYSKLSLTNLIEHAVKAYDDKLSNNSVGSDVAQFFAERYRAIYNEQHLSIDCLLAVQAVCTASQNPYDIDLRVNAVAAFKALAEAEALSTANKRVANILAKNTSTEVTAEFDASKLEETAETALVAALDAISSKVEAHINAGQYTDGLKALASLAAPLDAFFDNVMVMADDMALRANRIAILKRIRSLFILTADISELQF